MLYIWVSKLQKISSINENRKLLILSFKFCTFINIYLLKHYPDYREDFSDLNIIQIIEKVYDVALNKN